MKKDDFERIGGSVFRNPSNTKMPDGKKGSPWLLFIMLILIAVGCTVYLYLIVESKVDKPFEPQGIKPVREFVVTKMPKEPVRVNFIQILGETRLAERVFVCQPEGVRHEK